ncbi:MAG TPA: alpha/beta hydrolase [Blastocatellia bacterium]|nr:alpha/beta hydrolase [Blastocatellia bacterium]
MLRKTLAKLVYGLKTRIYEGGKRQETLAVDHRVELLRGGKGPPLVYLNSLLGESGWLPFHQRLAGSFDVIAPVSPSIGTDADAMEDVAFGFLDLLDGLGLKKAHVVGVSLGGWIAAEVAVRHPERVDRLVIADALGLADGVPSLATTDGARQDELRRLLFANPSGPMAEIALPRKQPALDGFDSAMRFVDRVLPDGAARPFLSPKLAGRLRRITSPTLVLWGERDALLPLACAEAWRDGIPGAELRVLPASGHLPQFEQEEAFAAAVTGFLSARSRPTPGARRALTPGSPA